MIDKIIYDRVWLDDYLNKLKQYENYLRLIKGNLCNIENSLSVEQTELYLNVMKELNKVEYNFQIMYRIVEKFMNQAQVHALELECFSEEQYQHLLYFM